MQIIRPKWGKKERRKGRSKRVSQKYRNFGRNAYPSGQIVGRY